MSADRTARVHIRCSILPRIRGEGRMACYSVSSITIARSNPQITFAWSCERSRPDERSAGGRRDAFDEWLAKVPTHSSPLTKSKLYLGERWRMDCLLPRHAGSKIPMVIVLGNVIRMRMSDDASFWVPHRQTAAPKERKFCSKLPG